MIRQSSIINRQYSIKKVALFIQCLVDIMFPEVGKAMVQIFDKLGIPVSCPVDQTCCGQSAFNSGYRDEAKVAARRYVEIFKDADYIVCPSGSCTMMVRLHYPELFHNDQKWLKRICHVSSKTFELTEFLVDVMEVEDLGACFNGKITYHDSCHPLRGLEIREQPRKLINKVKGVELIEMKDSDRCCGFGGAFSVKYPEISTSILKDKVTNIVNSGADVVVGCDIGCLMNIQGMLCRMGSPIKTMHIAQLLAGV